MSQGNNFKTQMNLNHSINVNDHSISSGYESLTKRGANN